MLMRNDGKGFDINTNNSYNVMELKYAEDVQRKLEQI